MPWRAAAIISASLPTGHRNCARSDSSASAITDATNSGPGAASPPPSFDLRAFPDPGQLLVRAGLAAVVEHVRAEPGLDGARLDHEHPHAEVADLEVQRLGKRLERRTSMPSSSRRAGRAAIPATEATFTTAPEPRSRMPGTNAWIMRAAPKKFVSNIRRTSAERHGLDRAFDTEAGVVHQDVDRARRPRAPPRPTRRRRRRAPTSRPPSDRRASRRRRAVATTS